MDKELFKSGDRVVVFNHAGCKPNARGTITGLVERNHPADCSLIRLYWVQFDEPQGDPTDWEPDTGPQFVRCTVPPWCLSRLAEGESANKRSP
jgi:hypothetical protein